MLARPRHPENPDPTISFTDGNPSLPTTLHAGRMRVSDFEALAAEGGLAEEHLGHQLIVFVYTIWDSTYRPSLAKVLQVEPNSIQAPIMGDLRLLERTSSTTKESPIKVQIRPSCGGSSEEKS